MRRLDAFSRRDEDYVIAFLGKQFRFSLQPTPLDSHLTKPVEMPAHGPEVPHDLRIAIITMKFFFDLPWIEIGPKLGVAPGTAAQSYARTIRRATDPKDFKSLCTAAAVLKRSGRPKKERPGIINPSSTLGHLCGEG